MSPRSLRGLLRWMHIVAGGTLGIYLYSPLHADPFWTDVARLGLVPVLALSGAWMWQQGSVARMFGRAES